jgi:hypothetical protein
MSAFTLNVNTDGDAFRSMDGALLPEEISRILHSLARRVALTLIDAEPGADIEFTIRDVNGNVVGTASVVEVTV